MRRELKRWIPLIVWVVVIFALPNIPTLSGSGPDFPRGFDKVVHFIEYMVLAVLFHRGLSRSSRREWIFTFCVVVFAGLAIGALDEYTQYFIPDRNMSVIDWLADAAGILVGSSLATVRQARGSSKKESI